MESWAMEAMALARSIHGMVEASMLGTIMCRYRRIEGHVTWEVSEMLSRPEKGWSSVYVYGP
jgi:hypothetical protein